MKNSYLNEKGRRVFVSPFLNDKTFTSQTVYNEHVKTWESVCAANGWNTDGTPKEDTGEPNSGGGSEPVSNAETSTEEVVEEVVEEVGEEVTQTAEEIALAAEIAKYSIEDTESTWKLIRLGEDVVAKANGQANAEARVVELATLALSASVELGG